MNKKRMSQRKSQLRLTIQDFCLALPQNSDPIVGYLLTILEWQASLDVETDSILHQAFVNQIEELKCKLRMELKVVKGKGRDSVDGAANNNITKLINQFHKIKQVFSYCLILSKKKSDLYSQLQKFNQYRKLQPNLTQQLQTYLNEPIIFETIFHSYLRVYNINILTADLIDFLYASHQQKSRNYPEQSDKIVRKWSNEDIELLGNPTIIFKQLSDVNKKYAEMETKLRDCYVSFFCGEGSEISDVGQSGADIKSEQETILKDKVKKLQNILRTIRKQPGLYKVEKSTCIIIQTEPICNFSVIQISSDFNGWKVIESNKQFFLQTLYGKTWNQTLIGDQQFTFLREKIIKIEALFYLDRILAGVNVISYAYNQLDLEVRENCQFSFKSLRKLIGSQFINQQTFEYKPTNSPQRSSFITVDPITKCHTITDSHNNKLLYPSAINYFLSLIKTLLSLNILTKQDLLLILQIQSQYLQTLAQTIINIYHIIKAKQFSCYQLLRTYIEIVLKSNCWNEMGRVEGFGDVVAGLFRQKDKIGIVSQIVYQFDHNYSIKEALQGIIRIQFDGLTKNCVSTFQLYKSILQQIIQIRNGLKLDHYYSVNQIHEIFSLIPPDFQKLDNEKKSKHQDLYFQDIIHQICTASQINLYLPKLFFFFDLQLKFKRIVFKIQLCWSCNKQLIFDRKAQAFKDFISTYCTPILQIVNQCHSIVEILQKMEQIQRYIQIFSKQVSRFYLIQKLVSNINLYKDKFPINSLRQHISRLSLQNLQELNITFNVFNPIQSQKSSNHLKVIEKLSKNINSFSLLRIDQIKNFHPTYLKQRQKLASIIYLLHTISLKNKRKDHELIIKIHNEKQAKYDLYQLKQIEIISKKYEQWLNCQNLQQLITFNQDLLVISIIKTLRQMQDESFVASQDYKLLIKLMGKFQLSKIFTNLSTISEIQFWRDELGILSKYHQIYQLMFHFDCFNTKIYGKFGKKAQYKDKKLLNQTNHTVEFNYERSDFITKIYYLFQISSLTRMKLLKNLQQLQAQIVQVQSVYRKAPYYHNKLKKRIYQFFCEQVQKKMNKYQLIDEIQIKFDGKKQPTQYIDMLRKKMLKDVQKEFKCFNKDQFYGNFQQIQMFRQKKGYQLPILQQKQNKQYKIGTKKAVQRSKKPAISPYKLEQQKTKPLQDLKRKFKIQILKKSIQIRKHLSKLQLSENKIRQQIIWQTSKLQHSVIEKINQFISLSNVDQQQSYINFKHTVNLQTIKGIQNVIQQQTEMYMQKKNSPIQKQQQDTFITNIQNKHNTQQKIDNKNRLLDTNIQSILMHMKKIKIFAAWKKQLKKTDLTKKQWCNFNLNVQNILNNDKIIQSLNQIESSRNNYLRQNVTCQIMKQQNMRVNQKIQELKIKNLEKKVSSYRQRLLKQ